MADIRARAGIALVGSQPDRSLPDRESARELKCGKPVLRAGGFPGAS